MIAILLMATLMGQADVPPVPGLCSAPVPVNRETPGCYETGQIDLTGSSSDIYWQVYEFPTPVAAAEEARRHRWSTVTQAHARTWLYVLGPAFEQVKGGARRASIGPLHVPAIETTAHFAEAIFPPGMQTRVHSHPGPEAFYVVEGEQCMESPKGRTTITAGGTFVLEAGPHIQAAPKGRRNLVLILAPKGQSAVHPGGDWKPSSLCRG